MRWVPFVVLAACAAPNDGAWSETAPFTNADPAGPWRKLGIVRGLPDDGVFAPAVASRANEGVVHLWFTRKIEARQALVHATSMDDGESFASLEPVTGLGDSSAYATAWVDGSAFHLLYGSGSVRRATSTDGVHFADVETVLSASFVSGRFDALSIVYPSRTEDGVLFFSGYDGQRLRIGRAIANSADVEGRYVVDPPHAIVDIDEGSFDNTAVSQPHVRREGGRYWMWYGGYDTSVSNPGPYRIGNASSEDGITWTKHGVAVDLAPSGTDAWSTRDPVIAAGGRLMFYVGLGDDGHYRLHRAVR